MHTVHTPNAPPPAGHYSQAVIHNGIVYVAGQLPIDPKNPHDIPVSIEEQTEQALQNVSEILLAAGSNLSRVLQMTVYISDMNLWNQVNAVYARVMGDHRPARAVVPTRELHHGFKIEIQAIAAQQG